MRVCLSLSLPPLPDGNEALLLFKVLEGKAGAVADSFVPADARCRLSLPPQGWRPELPAIQARVPIPWWAVPPALLNTGRFWEYKPCKSLIAAAAALHGPGLCFGSPTALKQQILVLETREETGTEH